MPFEPSVLDGGKQPGAVGKTPTKKRFLRPVGDVLKNTAAPVWLVKKLIEDKSLILMFGEAESGKSLLVLHLILCIVTGRDFFGLKVRQGPVVYIAGEGHNGLVRRLKAWSMHHEAPLDDAPLFVSWSAASLFDAEAALYASDAVEDVVRETGEAPVLVVIDTLARNFGPGNENATSDMNRVIAHMDTYLKDRFDTTVLVVHHTGHEAKDRGRGNSALKAAVDAEYLVRKDDNLIRLTATKMKDAEYPEGMAFELEIIDLGIVDEDGESVTSVVLNSVEYNEGPESRAAGLGKNQKLALGILRKLYREARQNLADDGRNPDAASIDLEVWRDALPENVAERREFYRVKSGLERKKLINVEHPYVYIADF